MYYYYFFLCLAESTTSWAHARVGRLIVVIDVNPSHGFWTIPNARLIKVFGHEGKCNMHIQHP
jgi:hypothetical protein